MTGGKKMTMTSPIWWSDEDRILTEATAPCGHDAQESHVVQLYSDGQLEMECEDTAHTLVYILSLPDGRYPKRFTERPRIDAPA